MHRFFIPKEWLDGNSVLVKGEPAHQIYYVLRLKPKEHIVVMDNSGWEYEVEIEQVGKELIQSKVVKKSLATTEPKTRLTLYQALLKTDKFEFVLQKGVELGVSGFVPFLGERCVARKPGESKLARWQKIIQEAAEQSGRALLPTLHPVVSFPEACRLATSPSILLWERERSQGLAEFLRTPTFLNSPALGIFVGPEGGFSSTEVKYAEAQGIFPIGLGHRILRAETAGLVALSAVLYAKRELE